MKLAFYFLLITLALQSCAVSVTQQGSAVRMIDKQSDYNCKFVHVVTGSGSLGWTTAHDAEGAMNEARNRAAKAGANAIRVVNIDANMEGTVVIAEALNCEFDY